jgi:hypothetical protein
VDKENRNKGLPNQKPVRQEKVHTAVGLIQWPFDTEQLPHFIKFVVFVTEYKEVTPELNKVLCY